MEDFADPLRSKRAQTSHRASVYDEGGDAVSMIFFVAAAYGAGWLLLTFMSAAGLPWLTSDPALTHAFALLAGSLLLLAIGRTSAGSATERAFRKLLFKAFWTVGGPSIDR